MKTFDELWDFIKQRPSVMTVQDRTELEHIFNLMLGCECESYLEVGTAEGNSLYVLGHATKRADYVDLGEQHTTPARSQITALLDSYGQEFLGDSTALSTYRNVLGKTYDCVMIDGGHDFATVLSDAILYAPIATKYIFFHDIQMPEVRAAVEWWHRRWNLGNCYTFINSPSFGYAIVEVGKW